MNLHVLTSVVQLVSFFAVMPAASQGLVAMLSNVVTLGAVISNAQLVIEVSVASSKHRMKINVVRPANVTAARFVISTAPSAKSARLASASTQFRKHVNVALRICNVELVRKIHPFVILVSQVIISAKLKELALHATMQIVFHAHQISPLVICASLASDLTQSQVIASLARQQTVRHAAQILIDVTRARMATNSTPRLARAQIPTAMHQIVQSAMMIVNQNVLLQGWIPPG